MQQTHIYPVCRHLANFIFHAGHALQSFNQAAIYNLTRSLYHYSADLLLNPNDVLFSEPIPALTPLLSIHMHKKRKQPAPRAISSHVPTRSCGMRLGPHDVRCRYVGTAAYPAVAVHPSLF